MDQESKKILEQMIKSGGTIQDGDKRYRITGKGLFELGAIDESVLPIYESLEERLEAQEDIIDTLYARLSMIVDFPDDAKELAQEAVDSFHKGGLDEDD